MFLPPGPDQDETTVVWAGQRIACAKTYKSNMALLVTLLKIEHIVAH